MTKKKSKPSDKSKAIKVLENTVDGKLKKAKKALDGRKLDDALSLLLSIHPVTPEQEAKKIALSREYQRLRALQHDTRKE